MENAVELVSTMEEANPVVVVSAGWAAVEGLLVRGGEAGVVGADRMASIVACAFARAELGTIGMKYAKQQKLELTSSQAAAEMERMIREGTTPKFTKARDVSGLRRMEEAVKAPADAIGRVREYLQDAFRRLYNQRNLAMHRGTERSPGLDPTVRTVPQLVGAGLDRVAIAIERGTSPLLLVARAEVELNMLGTDGARSLCTLID